MLYLFDNQLVFCARTGDGGLKLKNRFDLARTSFSVENGLFRIYEKQDGLKSCALMQVYIKNKKDREKWQYLLKLEIGFAKIKERFPSNSPFCLGSENTIFSSLISAVSKNRLH